MPQDLHIVVNCDDARAIHTANALLGRNHFKDDESLDVPRASVGLDGGRKLHITAKRSNSWGVIEEFVSGEQPAEYGSLDAVILVMEITEDLKIRLITNTADVLGKNCGVNALRHKSIVVMTRGERFTAARESGKITKSFLDWCREHGDDVISTVFQQVQGRFILFETSGKQEVLNNQRKELVKMVDRLKWGPYSYTDIKFKEGEQRSQELEKQLSQLNKQVQRENKEMKQKIEAELQRATKREQELEKQLEKKTIELREAHKNKIKKVTERSEDLESQLGDLKEESQELEKQLEKKTTELRETHKTELQKVTKRAQDLERQLGKLKEESQELEKKTTDLVE